MAQHLASAAISSLLTVVLVGQVHAALQPVVYQTLPDAAVVEQGDRIPDGSRAVPFSATLTLDLQSTPPTLTASISNAVLEGGAPFALTVHSASGALLPDGSYRFSGDYLGDLDPAGSQYLFDWRFSAAKNGDLTDLVWSGTTGWAGGHIWTVTISNIVLVARPHLTVTPQTGGIQLAWRTNYSNRVLEYADSLSTVVWQTVTNPPTGSGESLAVGLGATGSQRFYRLRKP